MSVVAGSFGIHAKFVRLLDENAAQSNAEEREKSDSGAEGRRRHSHDFSLDQASLPPFLPSCKNYSTRRSLSIQQLSKMSTPRLVI